MVAKLRPSNVDPAEGALDELQRVIGLIRKEWPTTQILVRGDSAYAREEIFDFCEKQDGVEYAIAMATNSQLKLRANQTIEKAKNEYSKKLEPIVELMESLFEKNEDLEVVRTLVPCSTWYRSLCYQTEKSWSRLNFLKLGARITVSARRILMAITSACPSQDIWSIAYFRIQSIQDTG